MILQYMIKKKKKKNPPLRFFKQNNVGITEIILISDKDALGRNRKITANKQMLR